jgi:hypothetical protein
MSNEQTAELPEAVIVDMDGTLCDVTGIRHYVMRGPGEPRDFEHFHLASVFCPPTADVVEWVEQQRALGRAIVIVTARRGRWLRYTRMWLQKHGIDYTAMYMRPEDDDRKDYLVKRDIFEMISRRFHVVAAIDDNPSVLALWSDLGIPTVVEVPGWIEDPHYVIAP